MHSRDALNKMADGVRDRRGRYFKKVKSKQQKHRYSNRNIVIEHNYASGRMCDGVDCRNSCDKFAHPDVGAFVDRNSWRFGRRIVELQVLLENLQFCQQCKLGPVPLTIYNVIGEKKIGLSGYLYVQCQNIDCGYVNRVTYGKTHRLKTKGMPCFAVNTKVGSGELFVLYIYTCNLFTQK